MILPAFPKVFQEIIDCKRIKGGIMVIVIIFAAVAIILFSDIAIRFTSVKEKPNAVKIGFCFLFIRLRREIHAERDKAEAIAFFIYRKDIKWKKAEGLKSIYRLYKKYKLLPLVEQERVGRTAAYMLRRARIAISRLIVSIGTGDAFTTSIIASTVMILLNSVFAKTRKFKATKNGEVKVLPVFDKGHFEVDLNCIIHIKPVHIIIGYLKFLLKRR